MRLALSLCCLLLCLTPASQARELWEGSISDRFFQTFIDIYKNDPSAMSRFSGSLRNVSSAQMEQAMKELQVTHFTYLYPMHIRGSDIAAAKNKPNNTLSLMAIKGDKLIAIPYQIDEFDTNGLIWIEGYNKEKPEGKPGIWDDFDELVFMYRDGGHSRYHPDTHGTIEGSILREIRLDSPRNATRWVYLVENNPERSDASYVETDLKKGRVESTLFVFDYEPSNFLNIQSIAPKAGPHHSKNTFEDFTFNISTGIVSKHLRVNLTKDNIHVTPVAVKSGPIRNVMLIKARVWYLGLPTIFEQMLMVDFYEQAIVVPTRIALDSIQAIRFFLFLIKDPTFDIHIEFKPLNGAEVTFESLYKAHKRLGKIDGKIDDFETLMNQTRLIGDWFYMDSNQGWEMFFVNNIPITPDGLFQEFITDMDIHMVYEDKPAKESTAEQPLNQLTLGFAASGLPETAIRMMRTLPKINFKRIDTLGGGIIALADAGKKGKFDKFDAVVNERMKALMAEGRLTTVDDFINALLNDINRLSFVGLSRDTINSLTRDAIKSTTTSPDQLDTSKILNRLLTLAKERQVDFGELRYVTMNNFFVMPDWVGEGGVSDFAWQMEHAPAYTLQPYLPDRLPATPDTP